MSKVSDKLRKRAKIRILYRYRSIAFDNEKWWKIENVYDTATNKDYFEVTNGAINIKENYRHTLAGKVTIPDLPGAYIVGDFSHMEGITHIFFQRGSEQYTSLGNNSFEYSGL